MKSWYQVALFNLIVLALLGMVLRYKINFSLPFVKQDNLLHAHSHFAFNGWVSFLLQLLILDKFTTGYHKSTVYWNRFFTASTIVNYGTIISFILFGYTAISIFLTIAALWLSYAFAYKTYQLLVTTEYNRISVTFIKTSFFFLLLSSLGPYALASLISLKVNEPYWTHNALYYFLHFQYNGWFTFAVLAFLMKTLETAQAFNYKRAHAFFILLFVTCIPSYLFTSLWHNRPFIITVIIMITAVLQTIALFFLWGLLYRNVKSAYANLPLICRWLYSMSISAFILKVLLQFFAVYPQLSQLAFGLRPVIIGYLHLIFLAFISMYLFALMADKKILSLKFTITYIGLITFATGIVTNEILLAIQGFAAIYDLFLPKLNLLLFANTFLLVTGAILLFVAGKQSKMIRHPLNAQFTNRNT